MSESVRPHRRQPTRLPRPWESPGKNTGWVAVSFSKARKWKVKVKSLSRVWLLATPWSAAHQAPPSKGFSRQEDWSRLPLPSPQTHGNTWGSWSPKWARGLAREMLTDWLHVWAGSGDHDTLHSSHCKSPLQRAKNLRLIPPLDLLEEHPRVGSYLALRRELSKETQVLYWQRKDLIAKGCLRRVAGVRELRKTALPPGLKSWD